MPSLVGGAEVAAAAVEDVPGQVVAAFLQIAYALDLRPVRGLIDIRQHVQGLEDPPVVRQGLAELGRVATVGEHPQHVMRADRAGVDGPGQPQQIGPVRPDPAEVDLPAGGGGERAVVRARVDPPQLGVGQIGQLRAVVEPEQAHQPAHHVAVGPGVADDDLRAAAAVLAVDQVDHVQRVARGARHDVPGQADGLVVDQVEQRHPAAAAEVARVGASVDGAHRHDEPDPVHRREQPTTPRPRQRDVGLGGDERAFAAA
jgi:hypothetical protein